MIGMKALLSGEFPEQAFSVEYALKDLGHALARPKMKVNGAQNAMAALQRGRGRRQRQEVLPVLVKTL